MDKRSGGCSHSNCPQRKKPDGFHYGGVFIGMTDTDALKIDIYQIFNEL